MKVGVIVATILMLAYGGPLIADETEHSGMVKEEVSTEEGDAQKLEQIRERLEKIEAKYKEIQEPTRIVQREYERLTKLVGERLPEAVKLTEELKTLQTKQKELCNKPFEFKIVTAEQRMAYIEEGKKILKRIQSELEAHSESKQIEGMYLFTKAREKYQGLKEYKAAKKVFLEVLGKHLKQWKRTEDGLRKSQDKRSAEEKERIEKTEERVYQHTETTLKKEKKDIRKDIYAPVKGNLRVYEVLNQTVARIEKEVTGERAEGQGETEKILTACWQKLDEVAQLMEKGQVEEAEEVLKGSEAVVQVRRFRKELLSDEEQEKLQEQIDEIRTELRARNREQAKTESLIRRSTQSRERILEAIERLMDDVESSISEFLEENKEGKGGREAEKEGHICPSKDDSSALSEGYVARNYWDEKARCAMYVARRQSVKCDGVARSATQENGEDS